MKKIALTILGAIILNFLVFATPVLVSHTTQTAFASPNTVNLIAEDPTSLKDATFNVKKILTTDPANPPSYFKEGANPIVSFILNIMNYALGIVGTIAMLALMGAGIMFMLAQGNQQKLDQAKEIFKFTVIALIIILLSYVIVIFIQSLFITGQP